MLAAGLKLAQPEAQRAILEGQGLDVPPFARQLRDAGCGVLRAREPRILQMNLGKMCNQVCAHCHVDAGPDRREVMTREVMEDCLALLRSHPTVRIADLTGGAPEMNPHFTWLVRELRALDVQVIVRSNLTILVSNKTFSELPAFLAGQGVAVVASLPCYTRENTDRQRGGGVFEQSIRALRKLNDLGYGKEGTSLELHLVYNPGGPSLPGGQAQLEKDYKQRLQEDFGIVFNRLYTLANLPVSRFLEALVAQGRLEEYLQKLAGAFNPATVDGLMCRETVSVAWDGTWYDCDFNQMLTLAPAGGGHVRDYRAGRHAGRAVATGRHCYGCTAGSGSSCQGALV